MPEGTNTVMTPAELQAAGRRHALELQRGAVAAGLIPAPPEAEPAPAAPVVEEQWPDETNEPPPGGWATHAGRVMGAGWKPYKVDPVLGPILRIREAGEQAIRNVSADARNTPWQVWAFANEEDAAGTEAEIDANGRSMWLTLQSSGDSDLFKWRWENDRGRWERYWLFGPALVESLKNFTGDDADAMRREIASVRTHPSPPEPPRIPDIR